MSKTPGWVEVVVTLTPLNSSVATINLFLPVPRPPASIRRKSQSRVLQIRDLLVVDGPEPSPFLHHLLFVGVPQLLQAGLELLLVLVLTVNLLDLYLFSGSGLVEPLFQQVVLKLGLAGLGLVLQVRSILFRVSSSMLILCLREFLVVHVPDKDDLPGVGLLNEPLGPGCPGHCVRSCQGERRFSDDEIKVPGQGSAGLLPNELQFFIDATSYAWITRHESSCFPTVLSLALNSKPSQINSHDLSTSALHVFRFVKHCYPSNISATQLQFQKVANLHDVMRLPTGTPSD